MARFTEGWIRIDRRMVAEDIGSQGDLLAIWVTLLLWATRFETKIIWNGEQRVLPPGSVVMGIRELGDQLKIPKTNVARWLKYLEKRDSIRVESGTRGTVISICKFSQYQMIEEQTGTQPGQELGHGRDTDGTPVGHGRDINGQEDKETKKQEDKKTHVGAPLHTLALLWNEIVTKPLPKVLKTEGTRLKTCTLRLTDSPDLEQWRALIQKVEASDFCKGKGDKGWIASFDWFLKPQTATKILEGTYANRVKGNGFHPTTPAQQSVRDQNDAYLNSLLAEQGALGEHN